MQKTQGFMLKNPKALCTHHIGSLTGSFKGLGYKALVEGPMYSYGIHIGLQVVPIHVLWGQSLYKFPKPKTLNPRPLSETNRHTIGGPKSHPPRRVRSGLTGSGLMVHRVSVLGFRASGFRVWGFRALGVWGLGV